MAKKNNNILLISVFVVLMIIYFMTSPSSSSSSLDKIFLEVDKTAVTKIDIIKNGNTITLDKSGDRWLIENHPVDKMSIDNILNNLEVIEISRLVTDKESKHATYEVDDASGIKVVVYGNKQQTFYMGKVGASSQSIMIRKDGEDEVYASKKNFKNNFDKSILDFKDKTIVSIPKENIASMIVDNMGSKLFVMNMDSMTMISGENTDEQPQVAGSWMVNSMFTKLNTLKASDFSDMNAIANIPQTLLITVSKRDGMEVSLSIHPKDESDYYIKKSNSDMVFIVSKSNFSNFEKNYEELKEK